jgi:hypothetical protein
MRPSRIRFVALFSAALTLSQCSTEVCACPPIPPTAVVYGRVTSPAAEPVSGALVRAYSAPTEGCHADGASGLDYGVISTRADGTFSMGLPGSEVRDSICVFVFARPAAGTDGLFPSDTALVTLRFGYGEPQDSARADLVLRSP